MAATKVPFGLDMDDHSHNMRPLNLHSLPALDRSVSTASSSMSSVSGVSEGGTPLPRRRGYMRPHGASFSESAKNRDSVMSLGTIAHLQYYFARTGLLDGKGGQLMKGTHKKKRPSTERKVSGASDNLDDTDRRVSFDASSTLSTTPTALSIVSEGNTEDTISDAGLVESPLTESFDGNWDGLNFEPMMLPPTVSTYKVRPDYVAPPPDMNVLRRELREALGDAETALDETKKGQEASASGPDNAAGWYEVQGLHLLDIITLAIRAAKNYYTAHEKPQLLYSIKPERQLRKELYHILEILKRMASRNFAGGIRQSELDEITAWTEGIMELVEEEESKEKAEQEEREAYSWREGDWTGKEREREWLFLKSFDRAAEPLPAWTESADGKYPTPFLKELRNGLRLVHLHNECVRRSRRKFEEIKTWHTDTTKPYRCAENLRFWIKAAELRWDTKIQVNVMGVVQDAGPAAWKGFEEALLKWCKNVREELTQEWLDQKNDPRQRTPTLRIDEGVESDIQESFVNDNVRRRLR